MKTAPSRSSEQATSTKLTDTSGPVVKHSERIVKDSSNLPLTAFPQVTAKVSNAAHVTKRHERIEEKKCEQASFPTLLCKYIKGQTTYMAEVVKRWRNIGCVALKSSWSRLGRLSFFLCEDGKW